MSVAKVRVAVVVAVSVAALAAAGAANARGCNGYVNQWEWGCAPWDNNNGPQYPHYHGPAAHPASRIDISRSATPRYNANLRPDLANRNGAGLITAGGGNVITGGGGNFRGDNGH